MTSGRSSRRDGSCDEQDVADPDPMEPDPMSARFGPRHPRRARAQVYRHPYCTINHRSPETAARCANSAPVRARRETAERRAAEIAAARAARAGEKAAAKAARRSERHQAKAIRGAQLPLGVQTPSRRVVFAAGVVAILLIGILTAILSAHHISRQSVSGTSALSGKTNRTSGGHLQARPPGQSHPPAGQALAVGCRDGNPLANVYHEDRLKVQNRCITVTGRVAYVAHEDDGDIHVDLSLPPSEAHLLNNANVADQSGQLVTEIVPADEPGCTPGKPPRPPHGSYNYGICTGADISAPLIGARVVEIGPYVLDANHGWMEIHPVWAIKVISGPPSPPPTTVPPTTAPPATSPPPTVPPPTTPAGAWCTASASPANDGYPDDDVYVTSNQPGTEATASDGGHSWTKETDSSGSVTILLFDTPAGSTITVTVGAASCSTTAV